MHTCIGYVSVGRVRLHVKSSRLEQTFPCKCIKLPIFAICESLSLCYKMEFIASYTMFFKFPIDDGTCGLGDLITVQYFFTSQYSDILSIQ